jgi:hypothetical protein
LGPPSGATITPVYPIAHGRICSHTLRASAAYSTMHLTTQSIIGVDELIADHMMEPGLDKGHTVSSPFCTLNTLCAVEQNVIELVPLLQDWRSDGIQLRRLILENCDLGGMELGMIADHLPLQREDIAQVKTKRHRRSNTSGSGRLCPIAILIS